MIGVPGCVTVVESIRFTDMYKDWDVMKQRIADAGLT